VKRDPEALKAWYRQAMARRIGELRELRPGLASREAAAADAARAVAQALRGSGGTFGFPEISAAAHLVETADDAQIARRVEGLIERLLAFHAGVEEGAGVWAEWLTLAAGLDPSTSRAAPDVAAAWRETARLGGLEVSALAALAASRLGVEQADLERATRGPLRLVPEALMRRETILPIAEDTDTLTVASADPTSLAVERELLRLTGRRPVFAISPPEAISRRLDALLAASSGRPGARRATPSATDGAGRVLVVDDDAGARLLARAVLEKRGYSVVEAQDGVEALHRLRNEEAVSLVVADLNMPHMDGLELLWEVRDSPEWADIPVLVLTGESDEVLEAKLIDEGADDYLSKPLEPRLFLARVKATMRRAGA